MSDLQKKIEHAESLYRKAEASQDPQDFVAASNAFGIAANASHMIGISDEPKDVRQKHFDLGVNLNKLADSAKRQAERIQRERYQAQKERWSLRETLSGGQPPRFMNVLDEHGGFTIATMPRSWAPHIREERKRHVLHKDPVHRTTINGQTTWRPGSVLKKSTTGELVDSSPRSFYQLNDDVTVAVYKVAGYGYPAIVWFDNKSGRRIA